MDVKSREVIHPSRKTRGKIFKRTINGWILVEFFPACGQSMSPESFPSTNHPFSKPTPPPPHPLSIFVDGNHRYSPEKGGAGGLPCGNLHQTITQILFNGLFNCLFVMLKGPVSSEGSHMQSSGKPFGAASV